MAVPIVSNESYSQPNLPPPVKRGMSRGGRPFSYERTVQNILADREGKKTWPQLEDLERRARTDERARQALFRLETLNATHEYATGGEERPRPERVAELLDRSDHRTAHEGWSKVLGSGRFADKLPVLKASGNQTGWRKLGYPPSIGKGVGPSSRAMEDPERWDRLVTESLKKRLQPGNEDTRVKEYRRLYQAHKKVAAGKVRGNVSERSLYLDMKVLEEQLLPEHLDRARGEARNRILGGSEHEGFHPESRVRRFLGTLSALPENSRERHMFLELSRVATRDPQELRRYAAHLAEEIKKFNPSLSHRLLPDFRKALACVTRMQTEKKLQRRQLGTSESFQNLLTALNGPGNGNSSQEQHSEIQFYKSGLTVNGTSRDYTY